jgi:DNA-binding IclR family transcriptional regulator
MSRWGFLSNHAFVLIHVGNHPRSTLKEIAAAVGITERATSNILNAMAKDGIISWTKEGRRNRYEVSVGALLLYELPGPYSNVVELIRALMQIVRQWEGDNGAGVPAA